MLLTIDAGNTNVVFGLFEGKTLKKQWRMETDALDLKPPAEKVSGVIIASVVPRATEDLFEYAHAITGRDPLIVGDQGVDPGIKVMTDFPHEVGADRIVNAVAAAEYGLPAIVCDFGTATTFDVVDAQGNYRGGVIAPGMHLSAEALHMATAKLPCIDIEKPAKIIGTDTVGCMQSGLYWGYVSLSEGIISRIARESGEKAMKVIATGGLSGLIAPDVKAIEFVDPDLTLKGLRIIYERNA